MDSYKDMFHSIGFAAREIVCFTGGGGKTSLMLALARHLSERGKIIVTTTTRMAESEADPSITVTGNPANSSFFPLVSDAMAVNDCLFLFKELKEGKYLGFPPEFVESLYREKLASYILVEADGALRLPLKGYRNNEPPLPDRFGWQMIVVGIDALLLPLNERNVARFDIIQRLLGIEKEIFLTPPLLVKLLMETNAYLKNSPKSTKRVLCINKSDLMDAPSLERWLRYLYSHLDGYYGICVNGRNSAGSFLKLSD
jgi:probable selenium-dependent hydroxylase accessory protein YqeC